MTNMISTGDTFTATLTHPSSPTSGQPGRVGGLCGVYTGSNDSSGKRIMKKRGIFSLSVKGANNAGNTAVAAGDSLYYDDAETGTQVNKDNTNGVFFGYALGAVSSGATATIEVYVP